MLLGNLGADPDLRYTPSGHPVLNMRLATNETFLDRNKESQDRTEWHNVVVWGARGEALARILGKGACILVEGWLRTSSYEKDGVRRFKTEVVAKEICLTTRRPAPAGAGEEAHAQSAGPELSEVAQTGRDPRPTSEGNVDPGQDLPLVLRGPAATNPRPSSSRALAGSEPRPAPLKSRRAPQAEMESAPDELPF
jgi:single-strand DNA-binding protein